MSKKSKRASTVAEENNPVAVVDPRPAAAYRLGGHSRMLKGWVDAAIQDRLARALHANLLTFLNEMDLAVLDLKDTIEAQVCDDLRDAIRSVKLWILDDPYFHYRARELCPVVCSEADRALPRSHLFFGWYDFGRVIGSRWQTVMELQRGEPLPDLRILHDQALPLLEVVGDKVPALQMLVQLGQTLTERPSYVLHSLVGIGDFEDSYEGDLGLVEKWLSRLYGVIHTQLGALTRAEENANEKPVWDADRSTLFWRGKEIKEFKVPAPNQRTLLGAFQAAGWPPRIPDPFAQPRSNNLLKLRKTIDDLNRTLPEGTIRFSGDGQGDGVRWESVNNRH